MTVLLVGCLDTVVLREFLEGWAEVVLTVQRVKSGSTGGALIQYPKLPPRVSESLAARWLVRAETFPGATEIRRGGGADLRVFGPDRTWRIEVKGSGAKEFQTFGPKDYDCDLLMWIRFGEAALLSQNGRVRATLFPTPRQSIGDLGARVTHAAARSAARPEFDIRELEVRLGDLLGAD